MIREELVDELENKFGNVFNVKVKDHFSEKVIMLSNDNLSILIFEQCKSKKEFQINCEIYFSFDYLNSLINKINRILKKYNFFEK